MQHAMPTVTYTASAATVFMGLTTEQWGILGIIVGVGVTFLTYGTTLYFKRKEDKRQEKFYGGHK